MKLLLAVTLAFVACSSSASRDVEAFDSGSTVPGDAGALDELEGAAGSTSPRDAGAPLEAAQPTCAAFPSLCSVEGEACIIEGVSGACVDLCKAQGFSCRYSWRSSGPCVRAERFACSSGLGDICECVP